jgi:LmbE family N-acetylglucosaminyl deacetylase
MSLDVLAFFAHPDDETMLCGGTLALLARQGARVHVLIATRGEGGEMGEPALCEREQLGQVRETELRCAAQALGAASLSLMDFTDPLIGPDEQLFPFTDDVEALAVQVMEAIRTHRAGAVLAHGRNGEYGHPAHVLVYQATRLSIEALGEDAPLFYTVQGAFAGHPYPRLANADTPAHLLIDVRTVLEQKTAAALCHRTQNALFVRRQSQERGRPLTVPEIIQPVESLHRVLPRVEDGRVEDRLAGLLWASGQVSRPEAG